MGRPLQIVGLFSNSPDDHSRQRVFLGSREVGHSGDGPDRALLRRGHCLDTQSESLAVRLAGRGVDEAAEGIKTVFFNVIFIDGRTASDEQTYVGPGIS